MPPAEAPRIKFAVVREDPYVEHAPRLRTKAGRVLVVASGGCTALTLAHRLPDLAVTAFDFSAAQLAHVEDKRVAVARGDLHALSVGDDAPGALNQRGEFESLFRTLRRFLEEMVTPREALARYFDAGTSLPQRRALVDAWRASRDWPVAFSLLLPRRAARGHVRPGRQRARRARVVPGYFQRAFERGLVRDDGAANPFLAHVLLGAYLPGRAPDYVGAGRLLPLETVHAVCSRCPTWAATISSVSLSNVFDWSDDALVARWGQSLRALADPAPPSSSGSSTTTATSAGCCRVFGFDPALGDDLLARDRSLFYERILVGFRQGDRGKR